MQDFSGKNMNFIELQTSLQNLTKTKIYLADFARILGCGKANISNKVKNNSEITVSELLKIEQYYNISVYSTITSISTSNLKKRNSVKEFDVKQLNKVFGRKLNKIQVENNLLMDEMAELLDMNINYYTDLCLGKKQPKIEDIYKICANFDVTPNELIEI